jgi:hypothetical protein
MQPGVTGLSGGGRCESFREARVGCIGEMTGLVSFNILWEAHAARDVEQQDHCREERKPACHGRGSWLDA